MIYWHSRNSLKDYEDRVLKDKQKTFDASDLTIEKCLEECKNYKYAGVQFSQTCFCGNEIARTIEFLDATKCDMPCDGDVSQTCGGAWKMNLYTV